MSEDRPRVELGDMDQAADEAEMELSRLDQEAVKVVANWWQHHYLKAGHKRLARRLLRYTETRGGR